MINVMPAPIDPLTLGQKLVAVLEGGRRTATNKLAVLMALLDLAVESVPVDPEAEVACLQTRPTLGPPTCRTKSHPPRPYGKSCATTVSVIHSVHRSLVHPYSWTSRI